MQTIFSFLSIWVICFAEWIRFDFWVRWVAGWRSRGCLDAIARRGPFSRGGSGVWAKNPGFPPCKNVLGCCSKLRPPQCSRVAPAASWYLEFSNEVVGCTVACPSEEGGAGQTQNPNSSLHKNRYSDPSEYTTGFVVVKLDALPWGIA